MARYDYRCPACGTQFEVEHPMSERPEVRCPECDHLATQVFNASGIVFKGSGFYNTDQRGKGPSGATSATSSTGSSGNSSSAESSSSSDSSSSASPAPAPSSSSAGD